MNNDEFEKEKNEESIVETDSIIEEESSDTNDDSFTYRVDNNYSNNSFSNNYNDNKSFFYIVIGVVILIFIIVLLVIFANSKKEKVKGYFDVESKMVSAAKEYYKDSSDKLPMDDSSISVSIETLVENNYLKPVSEMVKNGQNCSGYVSVYKSADQYVYFPYLNCGADYESKRLSSKIIEDNIVTSGDGLYQYGNEYIFRGEYPKNYAKFDGKKWRIVKINSDGSLKLLYIDKKIEKIVWDDRYNSSRDSYDGINDFRVSRMLEYLNQSYKNGTYVSKKNKDLLLKGNWCIGKFTQADVPISSLDVCSDIYDDSYIGLLSANEVLIPSISDKCVNTNDADCTNYNYFLNINVGWTLNASSERSYVVYSSNGGALSSKKASLTSIVRPVVNVNGNILYNSGNGTESNPYIIGD